MLNTISKRQKNKEQNKLADQVNKGLAMLERKEYKQATIELTLAFEADPDTVIPQLDQKLEALKQKKDYQGIRSIGLVLLKHRPTDLDLLNFIGNCCRKLKEMKQANHFYRLALKINASNITAFHNLSACMANVDKYDSEIASSLKQFEKIVDFYYPDYQNNLSIPQDADFDDTCEKLKKAIKENWRNQSISEGQKILQKDIYNLGLFALSQNETGLAIENLEKLNRQQNDLQYLEMLTVIAEFKKERNHKVAIEKFIKLLKIAPNDRYLNANIAYLYRESENALLANKHFLICASLLDQSNGYFSFNRLLEAADQRLQEKDLKTALKYYHLASQEIDTEELWEKLGNLQFQLENLQDAVYSYNQILRLSPGSKKAKLKLRQLFGQFQDKAGKLIKNKKFQQASVMLERALQIDRPPHILDDAAKVYKHLKDFEKAEVLLEEAQNARDAQKEQEAEKERQVLILKGKEYTKRKEFTQAIDNLERASRIKLDKDVFMYLAHIYKGLKRTRALQDLMNRWHRQYGTGVDNEAGD